MDGPAPDFLQVPVLEEFDIPHHYHSAFETTDFWGVVDKGHRRIYDSTAWWFLTPGTTSKARTKVKDYSEIVVLYWPRGQDGKTNAGEGIDECFIRELSYCQENEPDFHPASEGFQKFLDVVQSVIRTSQMEAGKDCSLPLTCPALDESLESQSPSSNGSIQDCGILFPSSDMIQKSEVIRDAYYENQRTTDAECIEENESPRDARTLDSTPSSFSYNESPSERDFEDDYHESKNNNPFLRALGGIVQDALYLYTQGWQSKGSTDPSAKTPSQKDGEGNITQSPQKRKLDDCDDDDVDDVDEGKDSRRKRGPGTQRHDAFRGRLTLACPFAKKDPLKHRQCYSKIITKIQYVKQHLSRHHQMPVYCARCKGIFETELSLRNHAESEVVCTLVVGPTPEGVSREQNVRLSRRVSPKMTLEEQWYSIFAILFPGHPRPPSPYVDTELTMELRGFIDMMQSIGPQLIVRRLEQQGLRGASTNEESDLSAVYQATIAKALQDIAMRWTEGEDQWSRNDPRQLPPTPIPSETCRLFSSTPLDPSSFTTRVSGNEEVNTPKPTVVPAQSVLPASGTDFSIEDLIHFDTTGLDFTFGNPEEDFESYSGGQGPTAPHLPGP